MPDRRELLTIGAGGDQLEAAAIREIQRRYRLQETGELDDETAAAVAAAASVAGERGAAISGRLFLSDGRAGAGIALRLYGRGFGGKEVRLGETESDQHGFYAISYGRGREANGLELRAVAAHGKEIPLTKPIYELDEHEVVNVVAPAAMQPLDSEFERLSGDLEGEVEDLGQLAEARESDEQRDLTLLRQGTGWDARIVALASRASAAAAATGLSREMLYGLFRAGLPTDPEKLALVPAETVSKGLAKAKAAGVIGASAAEVKRGRASFEEFARESRRKATPLGAHSSVGDLLDQAPLSSADKETFERVYFEHRGEPEKLWKRARDAGVSKQGVERLRLQGKLAFLTLNHAPLTASLQKEIGSVNDLDRLVDLRLYEPEAWKERLTSLAGDRRSLDGAVPPAYAGESPRQRLDAYAADLARQVRQSFPTRVIGDMVERGTLPLAAADERLRKSVAQFLKEAPREGFELGETPVEHFLRSRDGKRRSKLMRSRSDEVVSTVKTIQRLYQISPSDHALGVLIEAGFTSADEVLRYHPSEFVAQYGPYFHTAGEAHLVSTQAQQVGAVSYTFYGAAKQIESAGSVFAVGPGAEATAAAKDELLKQFPTLESLFGSLDFCECEECRSVLSPAAYLVDLLQFVNPDELLWKSFVKDWNSKHPTTDKYEAPKHLHPFQVLESRRPDIPNLALTCENTNTALPYIDLVNEVLEHYIVENAPAAHDTGHAQTPELLAEPQNTLAQAYTELQKANYPLLLPFDLWTETVRRFFEQFEIPLWKALEMFRPSDQLFPPKSGTKAAYYRNSVFTEQLGLTPVEYKLLTGAELGAKWYQLYGFADEATAKKELVSAKRLSRRLGVTYKELIELVKGGFVNPRLQSLAVLRKLDIDATTVFRYKGHAAYPALSAAEKEAFEKRLTELGQEYPGFDAKKWLNSSYAAGDFDEVVVLADPDGGCDFEKTTIRYGDGTAADAVLFLKLNVLVRLWRRLGWKLEEVDRALEVLVPSALQPLTAANMAEALRTALVYMAHLKTLAERVPTGKRSRLELLTLWSPLPTGGKDPLYAKLFLTRSVLKNDAVFDDPLGRYLTQANIPVADHLVALEGALGLTAGEIEDILADAGLTVATAELDLDLVSLLYRYQLLANGLKLSVRELIALKEMTGLEPMQELQAAALEQLAEDQPLTQTLAFVDAAEAVQGCGLSVEDLEYLLRHRADPVGSHRPDPAAVLTLVRALGGEIQRIRSEHAIPADPAQLSDETLAQKLALIYPPEVVDPFMAMWRGTIVYEALEENVKAADALKPEDFAAVPEVEVAYDEDAKAQRLLYRGVLLGTRKSQLTAANPSQVLAKLLDSVQEQAQGFFESNLSDFLPASAFDQLFAPLPAKEEEEALRKKRGLLSEAFLPFLQRQLVHRLVVQTLAAELELDQQMVEQLASDTRLLVDPSEGTGSLVEAFTAAGERGTSISYFASTDGSGTPLKTVTAAEADSAGERPAGTKSVRIAAVLEVPATGSYRFFALADDKNTEVELSFDHLPDPVLSGAVGQAGLNAAVELVAGTPYSFTLSGTKLAGGNVRMLVKAERLPKGPLSRLTLIPAAAVERVGRARTLLGKVAMLIGALGLTVRELSHIVTHPEDFEGIDLNALPTVADGGLSGAEAEAAAKSLFGSFLRLAAFAGLKRELGAEPDSLVEVWEQARRVHPTSVSAADAIKEVEEAVYARIAALTRRDPDTVAATAAQLGMKTTSSTGGGKRTTVAAELVDERGLRRLWEALVMVELLGAPAASVAGWTKVVSSKPEDQAAIARDLRNVTKARYEPEAWQRVAQPIFDVLRRRQRDALVAYVMEKKKFDRVEQLFEYFLIDPGMEPVVQTSRIQLAIASVQLFVQRCLLNLEKGVHPRAIVNARHWDWMKRYRVWEANRKLFLYPENWLEPEFRDDKSNLFSEMEATLLQGEVSDELADNAFFTYLKGLEKLARLDVVSCYVEEKPDPIDNVLHVVGRTHSLPHEYFYRSYAHQVWMPWEPIEADIESDHVAAVVWRDRLHVFWVTFMEQAQSAASEKQTIEGFAQQPASFAPGQQVELQLHWTERFQDAWTTREAGAQGAPFPAPSGGLRPQEVLIHVSKEYPGGEEGALRINLSSDGLKRSFRLVSKNSAPTLISGPNVPAHPYTPKTIEATRFRGETELGVNYTQKLTFKEGTTETEGKYQRIVGLPEPIRMLRPSQPLQLPNKEFDAAHVAALVAPFFISDSRNTFYVEPKLLQQDFAVTEKWGYEIERYEPGPELDGLVEVPIVPVLPEEVIVVEPPKPWEEVEVVDPRTLVELDGGVDWVTLPSTVLEFNGSLVGKEGMLEGKVTDAKGTAFQLAGGADQVTAASEGAIAVVTSAGVDTALVQSLAEMTSGGGFA